MPLYHEGNLHDLYTGTKTTIHTAKGESRWSTEQLDHGDSLCGTTVKSTTLKMGCNCGETAIFHPVTKAPVIAHNGRVNNSVERKILLVQTGQEAKNLGLPTK